MLELLGAGLGLIGSLFGGSSETKTKEHSESTSDSASASSIDYQAMVNAATSAGFNPLTAIRTGGASGFVTTRQQTKTVSDGESTSNTSSGPDFSGIGNAIGSVASIASGMNNAADPIRARSTMLRSGKSSSSALVDSQLRGAQKRPAGSIYNGASGSAVKVSSNAPSLSTGKKSSSAKGQFYGPEMPRHLKLDKAVSLFVTAYDDNGVGHRIPNPDLPDLDQMAVPTAAIVFSEAGKAKDSSQYLWDNWMFNNAPTPGVQGQGRWGSRVQPR